MRNSSLDICKKHYPMIYRLWTEGNDECKGVAYNIYHHNWGHTFDKNIANFCKSIGFNVCDDKENESSYYIKY